MHERGMPILDSPSPVRSNRSAGQSDPHPRSGRAGEGAFSKARQHSREVLRDLQFSDRDLDELVAAGVIRTS